MSLKVVIPNYQPETPDLLQKITGNLTDVYFQGQSGPKYTLDVKRSVSNLKQTVKAIEMIFGCESAIIIMREAGILGESIFYTSTFVDKDGAEIDTEDFDLHGTYSRFSYHSALHDDCKIGRLPKTDTAIRDFVTRMKLGGYTEYMRDVPTYTEKLEVKAAATSNRRRK